MSESVDPQELPLAGAAPGTPKHAQLRTILAERIAHDWGPHTAIPSERELMADFGVSRATVREAIRQLVEEGRLYRVHGKGTFVEGARVQSQLHLASFTEDMRRRGLIPNTIVNACELIPASREVRAALLLPEGAMVWYVERLRLASGVAMAFERGSYPETLFPGLDRHDLGGSLYSVLAEEYGQGIDHAEQTVWAEPAGTEIADLMEIPADTSMLVFRRTASVGEQPAEHILSWYRGDRYQIHMSL
ncbi:MAG: GntR family transcriptional regulator [Propioniciclava sp.]